MKIYNDIQIEGLSTQQVSQNYGLKVTRVEAIVKLMEIEQKWAKRVCIRERYFTNAAAVYDETTLQKIYSISLEDTING